MLIYILKYKLPIPFHLDMNGNVYPTEEGRVDKLLFYLDTHLIYAKGNYHVSRSLRHLLVTKQILWHFYCVRHGPDIRT